MSTESTPTTPLDFDTWLETGTTAVRTVTLYADRAVVDELEVLDRRRAQAQAVIDAGEASASDEAEVAQIDADMDALYERWEASRETWIVRALAPEEIEAVQERHPVPPAPKKPGNAAHPSKAPEYERKSVEWAKEATRIRLEANFDYLAVAVTSIETSRGVIDGVTAENLRKLHARPGRQGDIALLMDGAARALKGDEEPPVPFSRRASETDHS